MCSYMRCSLSLTLGRCCFWGMEAPPSELKRIAGGRRIIRVCDPRRTEIDTADQGGRDPERPTGSRRLLLDLGRADGLGPPRVSRGGALPAAGRERPPHCACAVGRPPDGGAIGMLLSLLTWTVQVPGTGIGGVGFCPFLHELGKVLNPDKN